MKKLILILLISTSLYSQTEYVSFQFDVNNLLDLKDNDRMIKQVNGLDFDIEAGAISDRNLALYVFYGAFPNAYYVNYGFGLDYYLKPLERLELSLGNKYHVAIRTKKYSYLGATDSWINPRGKVSYDLSFLIVEFIAEFTQRNDIDKRIFEGKVGIRYNFKQ